LGYQLRDWTVTFQETIWSHFLDTDFSTGNDVILPMWQSTDILLVWQTSKKLSLNFGVFNLFNKPRQLSYGYPEAQRRVSFAAEYSF
jgi:outer membrane cobalamin receptor